jgi:hypothetical protein
VSRPGPGRPREVEESQRAVCERVGSEVVHPGPGERTGISADPHAVGATGEWPLNGLRHPPENGTTGWYLWRGEAFPSGDDAFVPVHTEHLLDDLPEVVPYLALAPGWRILLAPGHEDVWYDESLLHVDD